ncbi:MAG TPA: hypothetical protein VKV26_23985 [Dehalococcoidia bacterium]|nr:hypothetical protein [Dehalococcoidia bacterium]
MIQPWWERIGGPGLAQGDLLPDCIVPIMPPDYEPPLLDDEGDYTFGGAVFDLIIITQSCDLENDKAPLVATCPIFTIADYERENEAFKRKGRWEQVRKGQIEGLYLLASPDEPDDNRKAQVADFHQIYSLPVGYLINHTARLGSRWRLRSPYLEHYSQAFARFFMRVGLPSDLPPFR